MDLTLRELNGIVDARMVDIEDKLQSIKDNQALWSTSECLRQARALENLVEMYADVWDAVDDKEMEMTAQEAEAEYEKVLD